ncbi:MAG: CAP domain-containing protein [Actinomycetota bacterium]|nr:CAP domain-containing protein [Actinomycetota bacterium]
MGVSVLIAILGIVAPSSRAGESLRCWSFRTYEQRLSIATNQTRIEAGLKKLTIDPELSMAARRHSHEMAEAGRTYHSDTGDIAPLLDGLWHAIGENVAVGGRVRSIHEMFLESPRHRENIFKRRWDRIGVGSVFEDGRNWVTVLFSDGSDLTTTLNRRYCA